MEIQRNVSDILMRKKYTKKIRTEDHNENNEKCHLWDRLFHEIEFECSKFNDLGISCHLPNKQFIRKWEKTIF